MSHQLLLLTRHILEMVGGALLVYLYYKKHIRFFYNNKVMFITGTFLFFFGLFRILLIMK